MAFDGEKRIKSSSPAREKRADRVSYRIEGENGVLGKRKENKETIAEKKNYITKN